MSGSSAVRAVQKRVCAACRSISISGSFTHLEVRVGHRNSGLTHRVVGFGVPHSIDSRRFVWVFTTAGLLYPFAYGIEHVQIPPTRQQGAVVDDEEDHNQYDSRGGLDAGRWVDVSRTQTTTPQHGGTRPWWRRRTGSHLHPLAAMI